LVLLSVPSNGKIKHQSTYAKSFLLPEISDLMSQEVFLILRSMFKKE